MSRILAVLLSLSLAAAQPSGQAQKISIKEVVVTIPAGSMVEVKLKDKRKFRGRMGAVSDEAFTVQQVRNDKLVDEKVPFQDVKSVSAKESGMSSTAKFGLGFAAGAGVMLTLIAILIYRS